MRKDKRIAVGLVTRWVEDTSSPKASKGKRTKEPQVLVCCRAAHQTWAGYWEFPGGKIETDEVAFMALKRELAEEVGIHCLQGVPLMQHHYSGEGEPLLLEFWQVTEYSGEPASLEGQEVRWQPVNSLSALNFLPGNREILHFLGHYLQRPHS